MQRTWIALGALAGLTAVAMAAVAAHGLGGLDPAALAMVRSGIEMQGGTRWRCWRAGCGRRGGRLADGAGAAFAVGLVLFCGAVYALALGGLPLVMAPVGGTLLMVGWALLGLSAVIATRQA